MARSLNLTTHTAEKYNSEMRRLATEMAGEANRMGRAAGVGSSPSSTGSGMQSIAAFTAKRGNVVDRLGISFKYYLVFVEHGVGRARSVKDSPGKSRSRQPRPFLSKAVEKQFDKVSEAAATLSADDMSHRNDQWLRNIARENSIISIQKI
jgi:hypothetical protein